MLFLPEDPTDKSHVKNERCAKDCLHNRDKIIRCRENCYDLKNRLIFGRSYGQPGQRFGVLLYGYPIDFIA